jgi:hypothetical protein
MRSDVLAVLLLLPGIAGAQTCPIEMPGETQLESARFVLGFHSEPQTISVGKYFRVEVAVCPKPGMLAPESLDVDARMPEHGHGMNYKARVVAAAGGRYRAEGLMFHMPGRWEIVFDVRSGDKTDRLTRSILVQ